MHANSAFGWQFGSTKNDYSVRSSSMATQCLLDRFQGGNTITMAHYRQGAIPKTSGRRNGRLPQTAITDHHLPDQIVRPFMPHDIDLTAIWNRKYRDAAWIYARLLPLRGFSFTMLTGVLRLTAMPALLECRGRGKTPRHQRVYTPSVAKGVCWRSIAIMGQWQQLSVIELKALGPGL